VVLGVMKTQQARFKRRAGTRIHHKGIVRAACEGMIRIGIRPTARRLQERCRFRAPYCKELRDELVREGLVSYDHLEYIAPRDREDFGYKPSPEQIAEDLKKIQESAPIRFEPLFYTERKPVVNPETAKRWVKEHRACEQRIFGRTL
jgi:hypothetical protein